MHQQIITSTVQCRLGNSAPPAGIRLSCVMSISDAAILILVSVSAILWRHRISIGKSVNSQY